MLESPEIPCQPEQHKYELLESCDLKLKKKEPILVYS